MTVKSRLLELLEQNKGVTLSGEKIADELSCTRAAVWKAVKALREEGYTIEAGPNRGYMLSVENHRISIEGIRLYLKQAQTVIGLYESLPSTNQMAKKLAVSGEAGQGAFVVAMEQTSGRGRRGRSFYSPKNSGIYLSVILEPGETIRESLLITTAAATAVYRAVEQVCGVSLDIKWVNDLYRNGRKVCGILTEAVTDFESGNIEFAIVGIGLNLYMDEEIPAELRGIAGGVFDTAEEAEHADRNQLIAAIVNALLEETRDLHISDLYIERNMIPGKEIEIRDGAACRNARALSICEDGRLLVKEENGQERRLSFGEVSVRVKDKDGQ